MSSVDRVLCNFFSEIYSCCGLKREVNQIKVPEIYLNLHTFLGSERNPGNDCDPSAVTWEYLRCFAR